MPIYTTTTEIQRNFKAVIKKAKKAKDGVIVMSNNKPIGIYSEYSNHKNFDRKTAMRDLLSLAGTMSEEEVTRLNKDMDEMFEKIDEADWKWEIYFWILTPSANM